MDIRPISTEEDYRSTLAEIDGLMTAQPGTPEGDRLDVLVTLVEAYEKEAHPLPPPDPVDAILFRMEQEDEAAIVQTRAESRETFPGDLVEALVTGATHPVKLFRDHRGLTQKALADRAGIDPVYLSQIETDRRTGSLTTLRKLAAALDIDLDLVLPQEPSA